VVLLSEQTAARGRSLESIFEDDQLLVDQANPDTTRRRSRSSRTRM
jgi:hypothetical protein